MALDAFINKFSGFTEEYLFYNGAITLRYDPKQHVYYLVTPNGLVEQDGVTSVVHIIDKSDALINWAVKMMGDKLLALAEPYLPHATGGLSVDYWIPSDLLPELVNKAKTAHRDKLDEATNVGKIAHAWIEEYIHASMIPDIEQAIAAKTSIFGKLPDDPQAANCCLAAINWMDNHTIRWIHTEKKIYSREYRYAGTMDGLCLANSCNNPNCCKSYFSDALTLADWKTSNALYPEMLLQTAAYQNAYSEEHGVFITHRWVIRLGKEEAQFEPWHIDSLTDHRMDFEAFRDALALTRSIKAVKLRLKDIEDEAKALRKEAKKKATEAALTLQCKGFTKYQGKRKPACNKGNPCLACIRKYEETHKGNE